VEPEKFAQLVSMAHEAGIKIEITRGVPTWEAFPGSRHQKAVRRIERAIEPIPGHSAGCGCFELADTYLRFPDGSIKRPDVSIFCEEPPDSDEALEIVPQAVIEVVSKDYEYKDLELNPTFYLSHGVLDVVVFDPRTADVIHHRREVVTRHVSPVTLELLCGCRVTV
jgi:Uma2 family endonuclease